MKISIIIPAFNEAKVIEACVQSAFAALRANATAGLMSEVIVVDNNSKDATAELARRAGAEVVFEAINSFSGARNKGASVASGEWLIFLDADTLLPAETLADALKEMEGGIAVGGTSTIDYGEVKWSIWLFAKASNLVIRTLKLTPGIFVFCRAQAFREIGGFDEKFLAGEDADFSARLGRWGRQHGLKIRILHENPVKTSDRKFHLYGFKEILTVIARCLLFPKRTMHNKKHLRMFYDGKR
ncbi:glycosyltransferase [Pedosphaera parvula]|nr:glycosyltransferase [Pedosphaera parvula]